MSRHQRSGGAWACHRALGQPVGHFTTDTVIANGLKTWILRVKTQNFRQSRKASLKSWGKKVFTNKVDKFNYIKVKRYNEENENEKGQCNM